MIDADLAVTGIGELATPLGTAARTGTDQGRLHVVADAAVACRDGAIVFAGTQAEFHQRVEVNGETLDARGGTVLPGFVDCHTHLPFAGWRDDEFAERLKGVTYSEIAARGGGILNSVRQLRKLSRQDLVERCRSRLDAMMAGGTTTVEAKSGYGLSLDDEIKQLEAIRDVSAQHPLRLVSTFLGAHTVPEEFRPDRRDDYLTLLIDTILPAVKERGLAEYADAFVDANAFTLDEADAFLTAASDAGLGVRLHADQLADDGAAGLAAELGAASADHLEYVSDAGIAAMAKAGTTAVLLPAVTLFLKMQQHAPGRKLVDAGVPVALATDYNPGSCPCHSMTTVLWIACLTAGLEVDEAITAATLNAAASLGRAGRIGSIEPGKRADLVVHAVPNRNHLVYRFGTERVQTVVVDGQIAYRAHR